MTSAIENKKFIFVCGLHRSGTSLLHELIKAHPAVSGFSNTNAAKDEGQLLQTVYPAAKEFGGPGNFGFDPASFMTEQHPLVSQASAEKLFQEWSQYWDLSKDYLVEKSPPNLVRSRFLQALFPNSWFVFILRHPVAVAYATSSKFKKSRARSTSELIEHWIRCHKVFLEDQPFIRRSFVFRYEDLVQDSSSYLDEIFRFLELPPIETPSTISSRENDKYFGQWQRDIETVKGQSFSSFDQGERYVNQFGYSLKDCQMLAPMCLENI